MRRADRLIRIVQYLRSRQRAVTGKQIAEEFGICTRTVYRDMQALMDSHVPISSEAGVGYVIDKRYYMPPVAFDIDELEAIGLGIAMVRQWTDDEFAKKAAANRNSKRDAADHHILDPCHETGALDRQFLATAGFHPRKPQDSRRLCR